MNFNNEFMNSSLTVLNPRAAGGKFCLYKMMQTPNDWNPGKWVLIWKYSVRAIQWIPKWQGSDAFQKSLHSCVLNKSSLSIGRVELWNTKATHMTTFKETSKELPFKNIDPKTLIRPKANTCVFPIMVPKI